MEKRDTGYNEKDAKSILKYIYENYDGINAFKMRGKALGIFMDCASTPHLRKEIAICLSNPQKPLIFQGFTPVFHSNLICLPLFLPLRAETRATFYSPPTTLSSSLAEVRFASLVE